MRRLLVLWLASAVALVGCSGSSDDSRPPGKGDGLGSGNSAPTSSEVTRPPTPSSDFGDYAEVAPLQCVDLLEQDEIDEALGVWDRPDGEQDSIQAFRGETCLETLVSDNRVFVRLEPGDPADFDGGLLLGVRGEPVDSVGDAALWFGGSGAEGGGIAGTLSVRQDTTAGVLYFRIGLGRPDLTVGAQIEAAATLASRVLPRFPGMEAAAALVPVVNLCELVSDDEAEAVLAPYRDLHPATQDQVVVIGSTTPVDLRDSGDETCEKLILAELYVEVQQGSADDFAAEAEMGGIRGEAVSGVGDEAVWFGEVPFQGPFTAPHQQGILSLRYRDASFRIVLALPDISDAEQLDVATGLAQSALSRLPGYEPPAAGSDVALAAAFEEEPADPSDLSFVDNLLVKEAAGEWTLGEGLVATLRLLAGEADDADVLRRGKVAVREGTGIAAMAREYLGDGTDSEAKAEITRLLDLLVFTNDDLEGMAGIAPEPDVEAAAPSSGLQIALPRAQTTPDATVKNCQNFVYPGRFTYTAGVGSCLAWRAADLPGDLAGKYRIFIPAPSLPQGGWTEDHYQLALDALERSAQFYEGEGIRLVETTGFFVHGSMPRVNVVFSFAGGGDLAVATPIPGKPCGIVLFTGLQATEARLPGALAHTVAHELAHCFRAENFPDQNRVKYKYRRWMEEGLADYLAHVVYPAVNFEWESVPPNQDLTRKKVTLLDLSYANVLFFQFLDQAIGKEEIFRLLASMPTSGAREEQEQALADFTNMDVLFRLYVEHMIDGTVVDAGPTLVPFKMKYGTSEITGTASAEGELGAFGLSHRRYTVPNCKIAHLEVRLGDARGSARPQAASVWGPWPGDVPAGLGDARDRIVIVTSTRNTTINVAVTEFKDDPSCETDEASDIPPLPPICPTCGPSEYYRKKG